MSISRVRAILGQGTSGCTLRKASDSRYGGLADDEQLMNNRRLGLWIGQERRTIHASNELPNQPPGSNDVMQGGLIAVKRHRWSGRW